MYIKLYSEKKKKKNNGVWRISMVYYAGNAQADMGRYILQMYGPPLYIPFDIAQKVERRSREHNVSRHYRLWVRITDWPTKVTNSLSDKIFLNQDPV